MGPAAAEAVPTLSKFLKGDYDDEVRQEVAFALGEMGDAAKAALPALAAAQREDKAEIVREAAKEAIEKINEGDGPDNPPGAAPQPDANANPNP
jgi:HEAT repeat protein